MSSMFDPEMLEELDKAVYPKTVDERAPEFKEHHWRFRGDISTTKCTVCGIAWNDFILRVFERKPAHCHQATVQTLL